MPGYRVLVVVGDMAELCRKRSAAISWREAAKAAGIDRALSTGKLSQAISHASGVGEHFADKAALIARLHSASGATNDDYFMKGSRSAAMEDVVHALQRKASMLVWLAASIWSNIIPALTSFLI